MPCDRCLGNPFAERCRHETPQPERTRSSSSPAAPSPHTSAYPAHNGAHAPGAPRLGYWPGTECTAHPGYPLPCARCARDATPQKEES